MGWLFIGGEALILKKTEKAAVYQTKIKVMLLIFLDI